MERTEEEPPKPNDNGEDSFTSIHWLWAHISSQLIYFVLLQYASFPNIVSTLHEKVGFGQSPMIKKQLEITFVGVIQ